MPDAEGRPTDTYELNRQLADTIGASVEQLLGMGRTEADNMAIDAALEAARVGTAGAGQPGAGGGEAPKETGQPGAPTVKQAQAPAPVTAQEGEIDWEATKEANGFYLGKYKTKTEAAKGYFSLLTMAKGRAAEAERLAAERDRLAREVQELRSRPAAAPVAVPQAQPAADPSRGTVQEPGKLDTVLSKLQESGTLDAEDLRALVSVLREDAVEGARKAAREEYEGRAAAAKAEADRWGKVEAYMAEKHPESVNFTDELALFIKTHPLIGAGVSALIAQDRHEEATAAAWSAMVAEQGISVKPAFVPAPATKENVEKELRLDAADQVRREAVEQARKDAGVIGAGAAGRGVHENADAGPTQDEYEQAAALMRQGDGSKWRALVFRDALNHPLFG